MTEIQFDRKPYTVEYYKDGKKHKIRRQPPPKLHDILPEDIVTITRGKNGNWSAGKEVTVKAIQNRQPNTLTLEDEDGKTTFIDYMDVEFTDRPDKDSLVRERARRATDPLGNKYLLWP